MNIKRAKQEITNTIKAYLARDAFGEYQIRRAPASDPADGPPGIGKTQIMEQIAAETGVGLIAYTITPSHPPERPRPALYRPSYI